MICMHKRGQVTIFAIIGIIIIVLVVLFLFVRDRVYIGPATQQDLETELIPIQEHIEECLLEKAEPRLIEIGKNGGYLTPAANTYRLYKGDTVSYLCYNIKDKDYCRPRVLRIKDMEEQLEEALKRDLGSCINVQAFRKIGTNLQSGQLALDIVIGEDGVTVNANLPVKISKGDSFAEIKDHFVNIEVPLGRLYDAMRDVVNAEATNGDFDWLLYSAAKTQLTNKLYYVTRADQPYPDKFYMLTIKDFPNQEGSYIFQFFVEGEPR